MFRKLSILLTTALIFSSTAFSQTTLSEIDANFVIAANQLNNAEISTGQLASTLGSRNNVRAFGSRMVQEHTEANAALGEIALAKGVILTDDIEASQALTALSLSTLSGRNFDRAYLSQMRLDHEMAIKLFQYQIKSGTDPDLQNFARAGLRDLRQHLKSVENITIRLRNTNGRQTQDRNSGDDNDRNNRNNNGNNGNGNGNNNNGNNNNNNQNDNNQNDDDNGDDDDFLGQNGRSKNRK